MHWVDIYMTTASVFIVIGVVGLIMIGAAAIYFFNAAGGI